MRFNNKRKKLFFLAKLVFTLSFHLLFFSCWSSDGLLDTEECSAYRKEDIDSFNFQIAMYAQCINSSPPEKVSTCNLFLLLIPSSRSCSEPGIPFPWYKPKKLPGQRD